MDLSLLIWSFLIIFMLHNFEEIITIEKWFHKTYPRIKERIPPFFNREMEQFKTITTAQFSIAVCVLFIVSSVLIIISITTNHYFLFLGLNIFFSLNIFTHPVQSLLLKCYVPGLWTTLVFIIPYNLIVLYQFYSKGLLDTALIINALIVTILFIPLLMLSHKIAERYV